MQPNQTLLLLSAHYITREWLQLGLRSRSTVDSDSTRLMCVMVVSYVTSDLSLR